ncbi:MAG: hydantoinase/oxoprolinase family protein [Solirubrobacteraceae bacterium]
MLLGVDVGGTFTDAVLAVGGRLVTAKAPTTPSDQSEGVLAAIRAALDKAGASADDVEAFSHGTTVATNALLEGRGARTAFVATAGFEDIVELGRQARADLYRLCAAHPAPLVPPERRVGAAERMGPDGPLLALSDDAVADVVARLRDLEPEAVAVCLLHAYRHPAHEQALGEALALHLPGVHVSLSHAAVGTFREHERAATTEVDAALSPLLAEYLGRLVERAEEAGLPRPDVMQSSGGLADAAEAGANAATTVLSGPAGGAAGAAWAAAAAGEPDVLCFDMGGTSCDVCVVQAGRVRETSGRTVGDRPIALPMLDLHTVGAGGGSVAWADAGGALRVGPRSAGARPGPACYGHGGEEPTVTDAHLVLGHLGCKIAGGVELDREAAERAVGALGERLGLGLQDCAQGILDVANAEMVRALRVMTVERGVDPRELVLMPFGGAGPLHACAIAEELGITTVLCPRASGVLAALGLVVAQRRRDVVRSVLTTDLDVAAIVGELSPQVDLGEGVTVTCELRYRGQAFELGIEPTHPTEDLRERFEAEHERAYGYRETGGEVELVTVRVTGTAAGPQIDASPATEETLEGPAVVELPESTLVVAPGWRGKTEAAGTVRLWMP